MYLSFVHAMIVRSQWHDSASTRHRGAGRRDDHRPLSRYRSLAVTLTRPCSHSHALAPTTTQTPIGNIASVAPSHQLCSGNVTKWGKLATPEDVPVFKNKDFAGGKVSMFWDLIFSCLAVAFFIQFFGMNNARKTVRGYRRRKYFGVCQEEGGNPGCCGMVDALPLYVWKGPILKFFPYVFPMRGASGSGL